MPSFHIPAHLSIPAGALVVGLMLGPVACETPQKQDLDAVAAEDKPAASKAVKPRYDNSLLAEGDQKAVVAVVNGEAFTLGEYERRLNSQAPFARARYNSKERKLDFLNNMVQFELLADEAERLGYDKDPDVVLNFKQAMVRRMTADRMGQKVKLDSITEEEMRAYYEEHKSDYVRPAKIRASQIVLPDEATAEKTRADLDAEFAKDPNHRRKVFALMARERSIDKASASLGGDMRFFSTPEEGGTVNPKLSEAAFALEHVGHVTEPVKTEQGWHILMLTARKLRYEKTFDDVKDSIRNRLYREKRTQAEKGFVDSVKSKAKITINDSLLERVPDPPTDAAKRDGGPHGGAVLPGGIPNDPHGHDNSPTPQ